MLREVDTKRYDFEYQAMPISISVENSQSLLTTVAFSDLIQGPLQVLLRK
jgi:hypothetical protein